MEQSGETGGIARSWFGPAALAGAFLFALAALLSFIHQRVFEERLSALPADAEMVRVNLRTRIERDRDFLIRLAEDRLRYGLDEVSFEERAGRFVAERPEINGVFWLGPDLVVHRVATLDPARKPVGTAITHAEQKRIVREARETRRLVYSRPFTDARGNPSFETWLPLHRGDEFQGLFGIAYSCSRLLQRLPPHVLEDYWMTIQDVSGTTVAALSSRSSVDPRFVVEAPFDPPGYGLRVRLQRYGSGGLGLGLWLMTLLCAALALGMAYGMFALKRDMARRRQAEEARALLGMAVEQTADAIIITDPKGVIQYVNPAFQRITGYTGEEVVGENTRFLKSGKHDPGFYREMWSVLQRGEVWSGRFENRRKDGALYEEEAAISPVRDASGRIVHFVAVKRDVTRERQMEEQLRQSQKMEAIGRLAGGVAHDFNNLLTAITGYSDLLLHRVEGDSPLRGDIELIRKAGERAASLTRQLLAVSRRQVLLPKVLDLNTVVAGMEAMLRRVIGEDISLSTVPAPDLWRTKADPGQVEQVLLNLAVNAREAMPKGGHLTIETRNIVLDGGPGAEASSGPERMVMLSMNDTGRGIDDETMKHIFEPFFTTKKKGEGSGLGLSIAYGIVSQSGGNIAVSSEVGRGTSFRVILPATEEPIEEEVQEAPVGPLRGNETVLLVEDEETVRTLVRKVLSRRGYTVIEARDGIEGVETAVRESGPIHLLLTDVVMPRMGGRALAERVTSLRPGIRVLYMSGYSEDAIAHHGIPEDGADFIQKPFTPEALERKVREVLDP